MSSATPFEIVTVSMAEFRAQLAGLTQAMGEDGELADAALLRDVAQRFVGCLPALLGTEIARVSMWDKIAAALETAAAKAGADHERFIGAVLKTLLGSPAVAAANEELQAVLAALDRAPSGTGVRWVRYLEAHLVPVLVVARQRWKARPRGKGAAEPLPESTLDGSDLFDGAAGAEEVAA